MIIKTGQLSALLQIASSGIDFHVLADENERRSLTEWRGAVTMSGFKILGIVVFLYTLYSSFVGEVYAKDKISGRTINRSEEKTYFWAVIACYFGLSLALYFIF